MFNRAEVSNHNREPSHNLSLSCPLLPIFLLILLLSATTDLLSYAVASWGAMADPSMRSPPGGEKKNYSNQQICQ